MAEFKGIVQCFITYSIWCVITTNDHFDMFSCTEKRTTTFSDGLVLCEDKHPEYAYIEQVTFTITIKSEMVVVLNLYYTVYTDQP